MAKHDEVKADFETKLRELKQAKKKWEKLVEQLNDNL